MSNPIAHGDGSSWLLQGSGNALKTNDEIRSCIAYEKLNQNLNNSGSWNIDHPEHAALSATMTNMAKLCHANKSSMQR
jgi:hypothetical protein